MTYFRKIYFSFSTQQSRDLKNDSNPINTHPLQCKINKQHGFARTLSISIPHGLVTTPVYMPVGTTGTMKGITAQQMQKMGCKIMLSNTYHLANKPGANYLKQVGGLHKFMGWSNNILTDSGGYQMVSLDELCTVTQEGVFFINPYDKSKMFIGPQESIQIQNSIGSDIMMALDDVIKTTTDGERRQQAMNRTVRWIDRNINSNKNSSVQTLFPIVQGGVDIQLRRQCIEQLRSKNAGGFAIGGLSGGQSKQVFFKTVRFCCENLPQDKPRYLMGVGYPVDILLCVCLGVDMFDCVFPTRTARFGTAFTSYGPIKMKSKQFQSDFSSLQQNCKCQTCQNYTKSYLYMISKQDNFTHLLSIHNIYFLFNMMKQLNHAIQTESLSQFVGQFINKYYCQQPNLPKWIQTAVNLSKLNVQFKKHYCL